MDSAIAAALIGAVAAIIGGAVGGFLALKAAGNTLKATFADAQHQRDAAYRAAVQATVKELELNQRLLASGVASGVLPPLRHSALDSLLTVRDRQLPDPAFEAAATIAQFDALAELAQRLTESSQPVPARLQTTLESMATTARTTLDQSAQELGQTAAGVPSSTPHTA